MIDWHSVLVASSVMNHLCCSAYNVPPAPNNYIVAGKRPMSSMSTTIAVDDQVSSG
jgi:gamma-glutamyltranspeptidase